MKECFKGETDLALIVRKSFHEKNNIWYDDWMMTKQRVGTQYMFVESDSSPRSFLFKFGCGKS